MKIINHHLGLPVICLDTGERVGDVLRFITDQVAGQVVAVAVTGAWYQEPLGVPVEDCTAFGQNVILVNRRDALRPLSEMETVRMHLQASNDARQRTAITESGRLLGSITDEAFDGKTGEVTGYRLDILADSGAGRTIYVPHTAFMTASATVVILKDEVLDLAVPTLEALDSNAPTPATEPSGEASTVGAFPGAEALSYGASPPDAEVDESLEKVEEAEAVDAAAIEAPSLLEPAVEALWAEPVAEDFAPAAEEEAVHQAVDPAVVELSEEVMEAGPAEEPEDVSTEGMEAQERVMMALVIGKTAGATVEDEHGRVLLEEGQPITMESARAVRAAGKLYEVWMAARGE